MRPFAPLMVALLILAGCMTTPVKLRHPGTGHVVTCGPYDARPLAMIGTAMRESQCIQDFQRQGYERVPE